MKIKFPATESVELYSGRNERDTIYGITQDKDGDEWILTNKGALIIGQKSISNLMPFEFMVEVPGGIYLATSKASSPGMILKARMYCHVYPNNRYQRSQD